MQKILIVGSNGQFGTELLSELQGKFGYDNVIGSDKKEISNCNSCLFEHLDVLDSKRLEEVIDKHEITQVYLLAAILSAVGEQKPLLTWEVNMQGLLNVLELARSKSLKVYWPSSIAVFGPTTPKKMTPQQTIMEPDTVYGMTKLAGERWCEYYHQKYQVDVRSLRYPGLIGYKSLPGGGTTDYAVDIFHKAINKEVFQCFLSKDTLLPMMYMPDAVKATIDLMEAPKEKINIRSSYNLAAMSFSPSEIYNSILRLEKGFEIEYEPDFRQKIANSWPHSIDDSHARADWGWNHQYDLNSMTEDILKNLKAQSLVNTAS
ncbi:MAG: NAD-dependent epimerase/dehydratase family protein [Bacteroidota bacterium]